MPTLLVIEDDQNLRFGLQFNLEQKGFDVLTAETGEEGLEMFRAHRPDFVLLDVMLPGISGFEVLEALRKEDGRTPVTMLTARSDESDAVCALSLGADDYVRKPFGVSELMARIEAVLRRTRTPRPSGPRQAGPWTFDLDNLRAQGPSGPVTLTGLEVEILTFFLDHQGKVIRREDLLQQIWGIGSRTPTRTLDNHIARIRKKLEADPANPQLLLTVHGVGYKLA